MIGSSDASTPIQLVLLASGKGTNTNTIQDCLEHANARHLSHRNVLVVHIPHRAGDLQYDVRCISLALEVVRRQEIASFTKILTAV